MNATWPLERRGEREEERLVNWETKSEKEREEEVETRAGWEGRGEGRREKAKEGKERGRKRGGRGRGGRRLWKVLVVRQKPVVGSTEGGGGGRWCSAINGQIRGFFWGVRIKDRRVSVCEWQVEDVRLYEMGTWRGMAGWMVIGRWGLLDRPRPDTVQPEPDKYKYLFEQWI